MRSSTAAPDDWMSRHFFSGGMMPSDDTAAAFPGRPAPRSAMALERPALREDRERLAREPRRAARRRCCRSSPRPTATRTPACGCSAGACSSWRAPSCGATATARNGSSATIYSSRGPHEGLTMFRLLNFMAYQLAWFACVLGAAHHLRVGRRGVCDRGHRHAPRAAPRVRPSCDW